MPGARELDEQDDRSSLREIAKSLGPGMITGASDDDPSGIVTYSIAGAAFGYSTLWTALITFPLMAGIQLRLSADEIGVSAAPAD